MTIATFNSLYPEIAEPRRARQSFTFCPRLFKLRGLMMKEGLPRMSQRVYRRQRLAFRGSSAPDFLPERQVFVGYGCVHLEKMHPFT